MRATRPFPSLPRVGHVAEDGYSLGFLEGQGPLEFRAIQSYPGGETERITLQVLGTDDTEQRDDGAESRGAEGLISHRGLYLGPHCSQQTTPLLTGACKGASY